MFGIQVCHNLVDAAGITQFLQAVGELAGGGMEAPRVRPVWSRELLDARDPPRPNYHHPEYDLVADAANDKLRPGAEVVHRAFHFRAEEFSSLREQLPQWRGSPSMCVPGYQDHLPVLSSRFYSPRCRSDRPKKFKRNLNSTFSRCG